ncbi:MAG: hypothetical protein IPK78_19995 [Rhodospirillales bacterium]|nr:hypothetical protein [Rhodospirillales bacterium]
MSAFGVPRRVVIRIRLCLGESVLLEDGVGDFAVGLLIPGLDHFLEVHEARGVLAPNAQRGRGLATIEVDAVRQDMTVEDARARLALGRRHHGDVRVRRKRSSPTRVRSSDPGAPSVAIGIVSWMAPGRSAFSSTSTSREVTRS